MDYYEKLITLIIEKKPTKKQLSQLKVDLCSEFKKQIPTDIEILMHCPEHLLKNAKKYLITKPVRTSSGVSVVAIMSKPDPCPHGACIFCPAYTAKGIPSSYTGAEPATMRGIRNHFDSYLQVFNRLEQYVVTGHTPDKVELIIMGGTFPSFEWDYQKEYSMFIYKAMNDFSSLFYHDGELQIDAFKEFFELPGSVHTEERTQRIKQKILALKNNNITSLHDEQRKNESVKIRCIGLTIETKPDWGLKEHGLKMLELGCTRVELGVQTVFDDILKKTHRGHTIIDTVQSISELKDLGFKLNFHLMLGLPGVDEKMDRESLHTIFSDERFKPDMIKVYPCMVMPDTPLEKIFLAGHFSPIKTEKAAEIIADFFEEVPPYCRVMRVQRDIPTYKTTAGVDKTNLRQIVEHKMKQKGIVCRDIRSREVGFSQIAFENLTPEIIVREYNASNGKEFFISIEDVKHDLILGFIRLRFPHLSLKEEITSSSALIRELHVYGSSVAIGDSADEEKTQHKGFGKMLLTKAEEICKTHGKNKIIVISGIGVRSYYYKLGYQLDGPYVSKLI